jgi:hypothetical protein
MRNGFDFLFLGKHLRFTVDTIAKTSGPVY